MKNKSLGIATAMLVLGFIAMFVAMPLNNKSEEASAFVFCGGLALMLLSGIVYAKISGK